MKVLLGQKLGMTQRFTDSGIVPVTVVRAGPCTVTQVKGTKDGYSALQLGYGARRTAPSKSVRGHLKDLGPFRFIREVKTSADAQRGQTISVSIFKPGDIVSVSGVSKGRGFQGVVKRHGFHGSPKSHGHKDQLRMPGSIGAGGVQRVMKGMRMAGRMGGARTTVHNLEVIDVDGKKNLIFIKGAVPGARNGLMVITAEGGDPQQQSTTT